MNKEKERKCFERDESGHWYLINITDKELFSQLLYDEEDDDYEKFEERFSDCRLGMHISNYSFTDVNETE